MNKIQKYTKDAKKVIDSIEYIDLATVTIDGRPWNSPLWYKRDKDYNFYFGSPKNTQHSKNIRENGKGFIVIYDSRAPEGTGFGVYITAKVKQLEDKKELKEAIGILYSNDKEKRIPEDFLGKSPLRLYKITPKKVWVNDSDMKNGLYIDYRIEIKLK